MGIWLDFSGRPPGAAAIKQVRISGQPVEGVLRYIGIGSESKQIHRAEHDDYVANGLRIGLVAELGTGDAWATLDDYGTGRARAQRALDDMRRDAPTAEFICCAADARAASVKQIDDAVRYAAGFQSVLGHDLAGFFGFVETSLAVRGAGLCRVHWRCGAEPTDADKQWVNIWQRNRPPRLVMINGTECDINETFASLREDSMALKDDPDGSALIWRVEALSRARDTVAGGTVAGEPVELVQLIKKLSADVAELKARTPADVDEEALAAALAARNIGGVSARELIDILSTIRLAPTTPASTA